MRTALGNPVADFRDGQWESIEGLLNRNKMLVVERTGWGKSMVYFLATKLMRNRGDGPTLLISPLLSLMRNQLEAAERIGVRAATINSSNVDDWKRINRQLIANEIDVLLISPERLANEDFRTTVLGVIAGRIGLFVVDEAHCISDWGHDFRPDYRRIVRVLQALPPNVPVLATTATANDRVVEDTMAQLGDVELVRGPLTRESLKLQNINMPSPSARMAWLAETLPNIPGSGIIYTLTQRDAARVTEWLVVNDINAEEYHSDILPPDELIPLLAAEQGLSLDAFNELRSTARQAAYKEHLEQKLIRNEIKVLVATVALGMGFDKPDLEFVIHFQRPASVVHYYQQVGRAGRAVDEAYGILLCGEEDDHIADFFIRSAFPPQHHVESILNALEESEDGLSIPQMEGLLNISRGRIEQAVKFLTVESPSPIAKIDSRWHATAAADGYRIDQDYVDEITAIRRDEQRQMQDYMQHSGCLMAFLAKALDDPDPAPCGKCMNCDPDLLLDIDYSEMHANRAALFLRRSYQPVEPRKQWPQTGMFEEQGLGRYKIPAELQASEGRALSLWRDAGWGQMVAQGKYEDDHFADELVDACVEMMGEWKIEEEPEWVTCIPSMNHPRLVPDFAERLAAALDLPFVPAIGKVYDNKQQKFMQNSFQQAKNLDGVFSINLPEDEEVGPCLLVDDMVDSRWTFTVAAALLRQAGCKAVYPLALALNSPRMD
ncbi:DEAD/DEAH box helicase [Pontiellaceae bacterium B1224]|nr:DEAD/DEAH box helicase [Pontiellaceae bacterium B1224]